WQRLLVRRRPMSLRELRAQYLRMARHPRTTGIVLHLRPFSMSQAQVQAHRELIAEVRAMGKRVVCFAPSYSTATYHVACACDEVLLMPGGAINAVGYSRTYVFLADALARFGLRADVV